MSEEDKNELKKEHLSSILNATHFYNYFNKWGFQDGEDIIEDEKEILEELLTNIVKKISPFNNYSFCVVETGHNPYYIVIETTNSSTFLRLDDLPKLEQMYVEKKVMPIVEQEVNKLKQKLGLKLY